MRRIGLLIIGMLGATALVVGLSTALAKKAGSSCTGTLASGEYQKLVVPAGATCDGTDATIEVRGGVRVGEGATFVLGSDEGSDTGTIHGGVRANAPASLQLHFAHVSGGVKMNGGNGFFSTVEDNVIHGGATINGYSGFWLGFIRNMSTAPCGSTTTTWTTRTRTSLSPTRSGAISSAMAIRRAAGGRFGGPAEFVTGRKVDQCAGL